MRRGRPHSTHAGRASGDCMSDEERLASRRWNSILMRSMRRYELGGYFSFIKTIGSGSRGAL